MKMVYIANVRLPTEKAHGLQIMEMCQAFSQNGFEVELIVPRRLNYTKDDPFSYYNVAPVFKIKKLPCLDLISLGFGVLGFWIELITFLLAAKIYFLFKKYDFLYTREPTASIFFDGIIAEIHSLPEHLVKFIYRGARKIIVLTSFLKEQLVKEAGLSGDKILVAADGVDLEVFSIKENKEECRQKLNLPLNKKIVVYTGHLYAWKGAHNVLDAAKLLPDVHFIFVGGTDEDVKNFQLSCLVGRQAISNIQIIGQRPHTEIPYWLKAADVLVLPNSATEKISSHYTSPMKLFEYMASGVPIVASDLPSIGEVLNEQNAILVRPDDPEDLARGIDAVLKNKELADKIAKNSQMSSAGYSWDKRVKKIRSFII